MSSFLVAIDGGAAAGKSTIARAISSHYRMEYIDSGSFYRFITYRLLEMRVPMEEKAIEDALPQIRFEYSQGKHHRKGRILLRELRSPLVESQVSFVACIPAVRDKINHQLRLLAEGKSAVVEGRDIGTVVFPSSQVKIFLIAGLQVRNHRRVRQRKGMGMRSEEREVRDNLKMRDTIDSTREVAPLSQAPGALILDTTHSTPEETLKEVFALIDERLQAERSIECRTS